MELLAPAGNVENFTAAIESGADAVYVGAPGLNARNLSRDLSFEEISGMISHCHENGRKIYIAANSLALEQELKLVVESLAVFESLKPDGLIIQDIGLLNIAKRFFPTLSLHGSTLMTVHNRDGVEALRAFGCSRVVLARELTLDEIAYISDNSDVELEVFIHGAMCYAYSGSCLFSSYLGGKSGMRGKCVQPCRRAYTNESKSRQGQQKGKKAPVRGASGQHLFSMNDLNGLEVVKTLEEIGVSSLKIEGRLRSANYVSQIVKAYRLVMDADKNNYQESLKHAQELADSSMSRKMSVGYFLTKQPEHALTAHHSGNIGIHLGKVGPVTIVDGTSYLKIHLKAPLQKGDRVRLHQRSSGERVPFSVKEIVKNDLPVQQGMVDENVQIRLTDTIASKFSGGGDLYKVDIARGKGATLKIEYDREKKTLLTIGKKASSHVADVLEKMGWQTTEQNEQDRKRAKRPQKRPSKQRTSTRKLPIDLWLKTDSLKILTNELPFKPERVLIPLDQKLVNQAGLIKRSLGHASRSVIWCLPPVIHDRDLLKLSKLIKTVVRNGFKSFQISHLSQKRFFSREKVYLYGNYTLNLMNSQAYIAAITKVGLSASQISLELDKEGIRELVLGYKGFCRNIENKGQGKKDSAVGMTVYGRPPLFTSRLQGSNFQLGKTIVSPKQERFVIEKNLNIFNTYAERPFSLLPFLYELKADGVDYGVVDIEGLNCGKKQMQELADRVFSRGKFLKLPTFNYLGKLE